MLYIQLCVIIIFGEFKINFELFGAIGKDIYDNSNWKLFYMNIIQI